MKMGAIILMNSTSVGANGFQIGLGDVIYGV